MTTRVSVIVVTHESEVVVAGCLRALRAAFDGACTYETIVVDNASTDATADVVASTAPDARRIILPGNRGYGAGVNAGLAVSDPATSAVLVLNPDVHLAPASVAPMLAALDGGAGIAVPRLVGPDGIRHLSLRREPSPRRALAEAVLGGRRAGRLAVGESVASASAYRDGAVADWATGAAMLISRDLIDDIGVFDESFFLYSEETDFMLRARDAGRPTRFAAEARAVHLGGELVRRPDLWALRARNRVTLHRRRHSRASTAAMLAATALGEGLRSLTGRATSRRALAELCRRGPAIVARPPAPPVPAPPGWICFSAQDWWTFSRGHSDFQLMRRVALRRPVLFVNSVALRMPLPGRSTQPGRRALRKAASVARLVRRPLRAVPGFHVMTPLPFPWYGSATSRRVGAWFVGTQVRLAARLLGVTGAGRPDPVLALTIPTAFDAASSLPRSALVVNRSDRYSAFEEADGEAIRGIEERMLTAADRVFYSSRQLRADESDLTRERARVLDHGVDTNLFRRCAPEQVAASIAEIGSPIVGFAGSLRRRLVDVDLLTDLAVALPDAALVLVGPAPDPMDELLALPNVHHLGACEHEQVPAYASAFDVALMPFRDCEWIRYANPIKLKEYLALGLAVVSTDFPEVHRYRDLLRIGADSESFIAAVKSTLADGGPGSPGARRAAVERSTWDAAARRLLREAEACRGPVVQSYEGTMTEGRG